jgi:glycosyltransferase involved in cell wall biosynthesis
MANHSNDECRRVAIRHYMAYMPAEDFGMEEPQFAGHASSHDPRSIVLCRLRDELGWDVSVHVLTAGRSRAELLAPLNIPVWFHTATGKALLPLFRRFRFLRRRLVRLVFSLPFFRSVLCDDDGILVFRGNMDSIPSQMFGRLLRSRGRTYIYEHASVDLMVHRASRRFLAEADRVFVLSDASKDLFVEKAGLPASRVIVVPYGVRTNPACRSARMTTAGFPRLLFVGMLTPAKGFELALHALQAIREQWPEARLDVAGQPRPATQEFFHECQSYIDAHGLKGHVTLHGWLKTDALSRLMAEADVLLFPSRPPSEGGHEGEPRVVHEAMGHGLPVVAIRGSGAHCESIGLSGGGSLADDSRSFSDAAQRFVASPHAVAAAGKRALEYVTEHHSIDAIFEIYKQQCLELLGR